MRSQIILAAAAILFLVLAPGAHATVIVFDNAWPTGTNTHAVSGVTFLTNGPNFDYKDIAGYPGVGVAGGTSGPELDIGESITASFSVPVVIDYISLAFLFNGPEYGDWEEIAGVQVNAGPSYELRATSDDNVANWTGPGTVSPISPATDIGAAVWRIDNPFGGLLVTQLQFTAIASTTCGEGFSCTNQSDYSLNELGFTPVPEPGTMILLGAGLLGLGARGRRKKL